MKKFNLKAKKQGGFVLTAELVLLVTILVFGAIVGMVSMRDALNAEMEDVAEAIGAVDQGYEYNGITNNQLTATIAGSSWEDAVDTNAGDGVGFTFTATNGTEATIGVIGTGADAASQGTVSATGAQ